MLFHNELSFLLKMLRLNEQNNIIDEDLPYTVALITESYPHLRICFANFNGNFSVTFYLQVNYFYLFKILNGKINVFICVSTLSKRLEK